MVTHETGVFHAIADPTRRAILDRLRDGGKAVNEIAGRFDVSRPAISKHLRVLEKANASPDASVLAMPDFEFTD